MQTGTKMFFRSFIISFIAFSLLATLVLLVMFMSIVAVYPGEKESTILFGLENSEGDAISFALVNIDPEENEVSFAPIPDNMLLDDYTTLCELYNSKGIKATEKKLEMLLDVKVSRYLVLTLDKVKHLTDEMGSFEHTISQPFAYIGEELAGTVLMNGNIAYQMFSYEKYDEKNVSMSKMGTSFLQSFLSKHADPSKTEKLFNLIVSNDFCESRYTNLSEKEIFEYLEVLSHYSSMFHKNVEIEGEYNDTSSRSYFIPEKTQTKNIF